MMEDDKTEEEVKGFRLAAYLLDDLVKVPGLQKHIGLSAFVGGVVGVVGGGTNLQLT